MPRVRVWPEFSKVSGAWSMPESDIEIAREAKMLPIAEVGMESD